MLEPVWCDEVLQRVHDTLQVGHKGYYSMLCYAPY
jgi:hypothetical protein